MDTIKTVPVATTNRNITTATALAFSGATNNRTSGLMDHIAARTSASATPAFRRFKPMVLPHDRHVVVFQFVKKAT
jgi:hypothetical protein